MTRWDKARYAVERECTHEQKQGDYMCCRRLGGSGWQRVDGHDTADEAIADAKSLIKQYGFRYRAVDSHTGATLEG